MFRGAGPEPWARLIVAFGVLQGVVHLVNYFVIGVGFLDVNLERRPFAFSREL